MNASVTNCPLPPVSGTQDPNIDEHPADAWINTLYTGGPGADTRAKLRRGYDEGHRAALEELGPWMPDDAPHKHRVAPYESELFRRAKIGDVVVPQNSFAEGYEHFRYATGDHVIEFERVRVHGRVGWLRRA